jgi:hypothetical protein
MSSACRPSRFSSTPATAQELGALRARLSKVAASRRAKSERAAARAANVVTPITPPQAVDTLSVRTPLQHPIVLPTAVASGSVTSEFTSLGMRHAFTAPTQIDVIAPRTLRLIGQSSDSEPTRRTIYLESPNVVRDGLDCTLSVTLTFKGTSLNATTFPKLSGSTATPLVAVPVADLAYVASSTPTGQVVLSISASANIQRIDIVVQWFAQDGTLLPPGYPSAYAGWEFQDAQKLGVALPPSAQARLENVSAYSFDPRTPYGPLWGTCRPAGWPADGPYTATKEATRAVIDESLRAMSSLVTTVPQYMPIAAIPRWEEEMSAVFNHIALSEGGGMLFSPDGGFDIRPRLSSGLRSGNLLDTGPFPREYRRRRIDGAHRPESKEMFSAVGPFQVTTDTFRTLTRKRRELLRAVFNDTTDYSDKFIWDAPASYQVLLQMLEFLEAVYLKTAAVATNFPPLYRAMMVYAHNGGPTLASNYLLQAVPLVLQSADPARALIACKTLWDSGQGVPGDWAYFSGFGVRHWNILCGIGDKIALNANSLRAQHTDLFGAEGLPAPRTRRTA